MGDDVTAALEEFLAAYPAEGRRILDVGCGDAAVRDHLERHHPGFLSYLGVDDAAAIAVARRRRPDLHRDLAVRDVARVPFPPGAFDLVIALHGGPSLDHLAAMASVAACRWTRAEGLRIRVTGAPPQEGAI